METAATKLPNLTARAVIVKQKVETNKGESSADIHLQLYENVTKIPIATASESKQIKDTLKSTNIKKTIDPPYKFEWLASTQELHTFHKRCVRTKSQDTVGGGWRLEEADKEKGGSDANKDKLTAVFEASVGGENFTDVMIKVETDYNLIGNGILEIIRDKKDGDILGFAHVPAHTMKRTKGNTDIWVQIRDSGRKVAYFKELGVEDNINLKTGEKDDNAEFKDLANEILVFQEYSPKSDYYGVPGWLPALGAILGDKNRADYNISFFDNNAIPDYAVIIKGVYLDPETEAGIKTFFQDTLKKERHSTLVLGVAQDPTAASEFISADTAAQLSKVDFEFKELNSSVKEASFRLFRMDNRDEIISAHGVSPYRVGVLTTGALGSESAKELNKTYKSTIVNPRQRSISWEINTKVIKGEMGIDDYILKFSELDFEDEELKTNIQEKQFKMAGLTPNQIRDANGLDTVDDPAMDAYYVNGVPITLILDEPMDDDEIDKLNEEESTEDVLEGEEGEEQRMVARKRKATDRKFKLAISAFRKEMKRIAAQYSD